MAIIGTFRTSNGAMVTIHDDKIAKTPEERAAVQAALGRAVRMALEQAIREYGVDGVIERIERGRAEREERHRKAGRPALTPIELTDEEKTTYGLL